MKARIARYGFLTGAVAALAALSVAAQATSGMPPMPVAKATTPAALTAALAVAAPQTAGQGTPPSPSVPGGTASTDPMQDEQMHISIEDSFRNKMKLRAPEITPQEFGSLFFTLWQHSLLQEAKRGFQTRRPTAGEMASGGATNAPHTQSIREISLGGIVYRAPKDWTIWLNGQRVTPDALPEQVLDLKVVEDHIDLKWFDTFSNLIYPIRLRAHQRFNLDAKMFLPGAGTQ